MKTMSLAQICAQIGAKNTLEGQISNITTDSRNVQPGDLFIALCGENFDGHNFVYKSLASGACAAIVQKMPLRESFVQPSSGLFSSLFKKKEPKKDPAEEKLIFVDDTKQALLDIANLYRTYIPARVVGVTGSVGKTSTKQMVAAVLSGAFKTFKTPGNQNNEIGMPKTLLQLDETYEMAVLEMGMMNAGEIRQLARCATPEIGIITNIGISHMENLGSRENILKAKMELADEMKDGSTLFLCADNDLLSTVSYPRLNVVRYGLHAEK